MLITMFYLSKSDINLEKSLLEVYRKLILYPNSGYRCHIQHPLYSFYYSEFCRLNDRPHNKKFLENTEEKQFDEVVREVLMKSGACNLIAMVSNLVRDSLCKPEADVEKIICALTIIEFYVRNIIIKPWKKEFHVILTYSGMFKIWIEPHLLGTDHIFRQFGYRKTDDGEKYVLAEQLPVANLEKAAMLFRLAIVVCFVVHFAQKRVNSPEVSLATVFEAVQIVPAGEHILVSHLKDKLSRLDGPAVFGSSNIPVVSPHQQQVASELPTSTCRQEVTTCSPKNKRDMGTQYDPTPEEDEDCGEKFANISLRLKNLDLKNFIRPTQNRTNSSKEMSGGARPKDAGHRFEETQSTNYGFSHPPNKNFMMGLSPEFVPIVDEEEEEEVNRAIQTPLSVMTRNRMKEEEENLKRITFSTFKKHSPCEGCTALPRDVEAGARPRPAKLWTSDEDSQYPYTPTDIVSNRSRSKSSLEYLISKACSDQ